MPVYEYKCLNGHHLEEFRPMRLSSLPIQCTVCGAEAPRIPSVVRIFGDFEGYVSPVSGRWVEGKRARTEDLARTGCRPYENGERADLVRKQAENERQVERKIDESVERAAAELRLT